MKNPINNLKNVLFLKNIIFDLIFRSLLMRNDIATKTSKEFNRKIIHVTYTPEFKKICVKFLRIFVVEANVGCINLGMKKSININNISFKWKLCFFGFTNCLPFISVPSLKELM